MSPPAIRVKCLSKRYEIGRGYGYKTLRESLAGGAGRLRGGRPGSTPKRAVWALNDVSFEVAPGEVVGIIGANGAGKTTVLRILSRITKPTSGFAEVMGRVGCLLEVGTGMHPELSGRENIQLSGAILGMSRFDIAARFDEIVEFADIGEFLDTPIKRYSSGMKVRLAFAVAAHLEPEILIVDEVLAVGDIEFQKKCLGKMGEVTAEGRTVLFVSHNMSLVRALCKRGILLEHGAIVADGSIEDAVGLYLRSLEDVRSENLLDRSDRSGWQEILLSRLEIAGGHGGSGRLVTGEPARFVFHLTGLLSRTSCTFVVFNHLGQPIASFSSAPATSEDRENPALGTAFECVIDELLLVPGRYRVDATIHGRSQLQDQIEAAAFFEVENGPVRGRPVPGAVQGDVVLPHRWGAPTR